jgi:pimeloyl-ACP methyl ester carboxylesterase
VDNFKFMEQYSLERKNCRLHYWLDGPENRPVIAFTHGVMMDHRIFHLQRGLFSQQYRILTWDVRGHGRSRPDGGEFSIRLAAEDLLAILDQINARKVVLVGHSMGGYISQEVIFLQPECVAGLVTIGSTCLTSRPPKLIRLGQIILPTFFRCTPDALFRFITPLASGIEHKTRKVTVAVSRVITRRDRKRFWTAIMRGYHHEPGYRIDKPFLLTHGDRDNLAFGTIRLLSPAWAHRESQCRYVVIPHAGHNAHQDNPGFFNPLLREFLGKIDIG